MWRTVKLGDILSLQNGYAFKSTDYEDDGYFVMRITNVQQGYISTHNPKHIRIDKGSKLEKFILDEGDILISLTGDVGRVGIIENEHLPAALNQRVARVTGVKREFVNIEFLYAYMNSDAFRLQVEDFAHGAAQANVSTKDILSINVSLPPLAEQQRIVAKLDAAFAEIDRAIAITNSTINQVDAIFERMVREIFVENKYNAPFRPLSQVSIYFNGLTYSPKNVDDNGTIVLRSSNIQKNRIDLDDIVRVSTKINEKLYVLPSDILICSRNGSKALIGKSARIGEQAEKMTFGTFMMIVRSEINDYLQWFFLSSLFKQQIEQGEATMINQITRYMLDEVQLPIPTTKQQKEACDKLSAADNQRRRIVTTYSKKVDELNSLKSAILAHELQPPQSEAA